MSIETETPSTIAKILVTTLLGIVVLLMANPIPRSMFECLRVLIPQLISPEKLIPDWIDILFWGSVIIYSSYMKPYHDKLIKLFESVGASFATRELTHKSLALDEQEVSEIGSSPGSFAFTGLKQETPGILPRGIDSSSLAETPTAPIAPLRESCTPGFTMEEARTLSGKHSPSSPSTRSEETTANNRSSKPKERLPREKSPLDKNVADMSYPEASPTPLPTVYRPLRWHDGGKYLDGTPIPPRRKKNIYTMGPPTAPKATVPSQGGAKTTTSGESERGRGEEQDISDLPSPKSNPPLIFTPAQNTPGRKLTLAEKDSPLQADSLTSPPSTSPPPTRSHPLHKRLGELISSHNQKNVSSPDPSPSANKGAFHGDEDTLMQEVSSLGSRYISNDMSGWGTTREPTKKEKMVVAVSTSWSKDRKASFHDRDYFDGVSEEDVIRITNLWAAGLLEVCERKLAEATL